MCFPHSKMDKIIKLEQILHYLQDESNQITQKLGKYSSDSLSLCIDDKGRGVQSKRFIKKGEILCLYNGELISFSQEKKLTAETSTCFLFFIKFQEKSWCLDATKENYTFGRLINHSQKHANLKPVACVVDGKPSIVFQAKFDIPMNTQLFYNYGECNKEILNENPWLHE